MPPNDGVIPVGDENRAIVGYRQISRPEPSIGAIDNRLHRRLEPGPIALDMVGPQYTWPVIHMQRLAPVAPRQQVALVNRDA